MKGGAKSMAYLLARAMVKTDKKVCNWNRKVYKYRRHIYTSENIESSDSCNCSNIFDSSDTNDSSDDSDSLCR